MRGYHHWTPTEQKLVEIWHELLNATGPIELDDDFFYIGGDSIGATLCVNRIQEVFQIEVSIAEMLEGQATIRAIASWIDDAIRSSNPAT
jgi:acyl carrier protein